MSAYDITPGPTINLADTLSMPRRHHVPVEYQTIHGSIPAADLTVSAFYVATLTPYFDRLVLLFNRTVILSGPALVPENWTITGGTVPVAVTSIAYVGSTVTLYISEPLGGESLILNLPTVGITTPI